MIFLRITVPWRILIPLSFNQGYDIFGEYEYLKFRVDPKARYFRKSIVEKESSRFKSKIQFRPFRDCLNRFTQRFRVELNPFIVKRDT